MDNSQSSSRNVWYTPLAIIALFVGLVELIITGGLIFIQTEGLVQQVLIWFVVLFPILVLGILSLFLWKKPQNLYSPIEYGHSTSVKEFTEAMTAESKGIRERLNDQIFEQVPTEKGTSSWTEEEKQRYVADQIFIRSNYQTQIGILQGMVEWILANNNAFLKNLDTTTMNEIRNQANHKTKQEIDEWFTHLGKEAPWLGF